jgi:hypothetical protein
MTERNELLSHSFIFVLLVMKETKTCQIKINFIKPAENCKKQTRD